MVFYAFVLVYSICSENVSFESKLRPSILGNGMVTRMLFIFRWRDLEYSAGLGVISVDCLVSIGC